MHWTNPLFPLLMRLPTVNEFANHQSSQLGTYALPYGQNHLAVGIDGEKSDRPNLVYSTGEILSNAERQPYSRILHGYRIESGDWKY
jgi:hypothetical protein